MSYVTVHAWSIYHAHPEKADCDASEPAGIGADAVVVQPLARQLLLLLVGAGIRGTIWQHLAFLGHHTVPGEILRLLVALLPFLLNMVLACYQHAGRYLEVWLIVLVRYRLRPKRYLWRSVRLCEQHLSHFLLAVRIPTRKRGPTSPPQAE